MEGRSEVVKRALAYPYAIPSRSFAVAAGRSIDLDAIDVDLSTRVPLLAYGSNAAPEVLAAKLASTRVPVPVLSATLSGFDVVYSAHVSRYGAVPATLRRSCGTEVGAFVAHLTAEQMRLVAFTEPNYLLGKLLGAPCRPEDRPPLAPLAFLSRHGCLRLDGSALALAAIEARRRQLPAIGQREALERVRDLVRPGRDLERFVIDCVDAAAQAGAPPA